MLINPPPREVKRFENFIIPPIGLSYVAGALVKAGVDVKILDANALQLTWEELDREIGHYGPIDVIGITGMTPTIDRTYKTAKIARKYCEHLILGGPHGTICTDRTFEECPEIDIIVLHEGEETFPELIDYLKKNKNIAEVKGIAYKKNGAVFKTQKRDLIQDLDSIPEPANFLLPMSKYRYPIAKHKGVAIIITSRGCPWRCLFCNKVMFGQMWRARSPKNVVDEIEHVHKTYGTKTFIFYDDLFVTDKKRAIAICQEILNRRLKIDWKCEARVNLVDAELLSHMKAAGCSCISFGVESANQKSLDFLHKDITVEQTREAFRLTKEAGIERMAYLIIGIPGETKEDAMRTIDFAEEIDADYVQIAILTPMEQTPLFDLAKEKGWIQARDAKGLFDQDQKRFILVTGDIPDEELAQMMRDAHRRFLLRRKYIWKTIKRIKTWNQLKNVLITGIQYLQYMTK